MVLQKTNLYDLVGKKNPNVSTLTLRAVKYLISALVGILLKCSISEDCPENQHVPFLCAECKTALPSLLATELFQTVYEMNLYLKARLPGTNERKIQLVNI